MKNVKTVMLVIGALMTFGVVLPALFSAHSTVEVLAGLFLLTFILVELADTVIEKVKSWRAGKALLLVIGLGLVSQACTSVPPGHVGVKVYLLGGAKGVDTEVLTVGRYWIGWNEDLYLFPTFTNNYVWTASNDEGSPNDESVTFQDKDGLSINGDFGISYAVNPTQVATLFQKYRKGVNEITDVVLRNAVRDALNKRGAGMTAEEIYSTKKTELIKQVEEDVRKEFAQYGIMIEHISIINSLRLPPNVVDAINAKIQATQKAQQAQNEVLESQAQADKAIATARGEAESTKLNADAQAYANQKINQSLTPTLVEYYKTQKWNGQLPQVMGGGTPFIQMK